MIETTMAQLSDGDMLDAFETYEFSADYTGAEVEPWRVRVRYTVRGPQYVYDETLRGAIAKAIEAFKVRS